MSDRSHVLELPKFMLALRAVQGGIALVVLGLSAYAVSQLAADGPDLAVFAALSAMIVVVYALVSELSFPVIYNYWAIMALDIYQLIIWLVAMAVTASDISDINKALDLFNYDGGDYGGYGDYGNGGSGSSDGGQYCYDGYCVSYKQKRSGVPFDGNFGKLDTEDKGKTYRGIVAAIAGISGLQMILFGATLVFVVLALLAHRRAGGHCQPGSVAVSRERKTAGDVEQQYEPMRHQQEAGAQQPQPPQQMYNANEPQYPPVQPPQQYNGSETHYAPVQPPQPYTSPSPGPQQSPTQPPQPYSSPSPGPQQYSSPSPGPQHSPTQPPQQYSSPSPGPQYPPQQSSAPYPDAEPHYPPVQPPAPY